MKGHVLLASFTDACEQIRKDNYAYMAGNPSWRHSMELRLHEAQECELTDAFDLTTRVRSHPDSPVIIDARSTV